ncbi:SsrA-binding protein SmpB [Desulfobacterales bacterium HSG2]|nr:SsrA-binding protein SmpB [Desulfobacterales bacterium HSG2]
MLKEHRKIVTENKKARFNYYIVDEYEVGMVLLGTEVKALRIGRAHLKDAYAKIKKGEIFVHQMHIGPYPFAYHENHESLRVRKLLLHRLEIKRLIGKVNEKGFSLIPLRIYFKNGKAKMTLALAKGKKAPDKRETIRKRDEKRDMERERKGY